MKPRERRETGEMDLFRSRIDQIINMNHELVRLAKTVSWEAIEDRCGEVYSDGPGMPPLPTWLMAGLAILKHTFNLSDEDLCARWVENPYFQFFCGETFFRHDLSFDRSSMTRWRQRMGEERVMSLLQESRSVAVKTGAMRPEDTRRVIVDTTVQPKNMMFPTDAKLLNRARERLVALAKKTGLDLRQSYTRVCNFALIRHQRYAHGPGSSSAPTRRSAPSGLTPAAPSAISSARSQARTISWTSSEAPPPRCARSRAAAEPEGQENLQPACPRGRMHPQGKGLSIPLTSETRNGACQSTYDTGRRFPKSPAAFPRQRGNRYWYLRRGSRSHLLGRQERFAMCRQECRTAASGASGQLRRWPRRHRAYGRRQHRREAVPLQ